MKALALIALALATPAAAEMPSDFTKETIREEVRKKLRDPGSAQFRWLPVQADGAYCGFVNARNSYGGYTGHVPFMVLLFKARDGMVSSPPVSMGSADPHSPAYIATVEMCLERGISLTMPSEDD